MTGEGRSLDTAAREHGHPEFLISCFLSREHCAAGALARGNSKPRISGPPEAGRRATEEGEGVAYPAAPIVSTGFESASRAALNARSSSACSAIGLCQLGLHGDTLARG